MPNIVPSISNVPLVVSENAWQTEQVPFANDTPQAFSGSPISIASGESISAYVKAYLDNFHSSFPLIHRPTFSTSSTPRPLLSVVAIIGSLYTTLYETANWAAAEHWRRETWTNGVRELRCLVAADYSEFRTTWVLQTWLLHIIYGAYRKETPEFEESKHMLRTLVDAVRDLGLLRQGITIPDSLSWASQGDSNAPRNDPQTPYTRWMSYIATESLRVSLYALIFLDAHLFHPANTRPLISAIEFGWELPFPSDLWEAKNPQIWLQRVTKNFGMVPESYLYGPRGLGTASLSIATQQLMGESPSPELLAALAASPFATLCILTNVNALIRDFTRCYYQLPPSPSDPSAFHILTQHQNKQIYSAMRVISKTVKDQAYTSDNPQFLLWRTVELLHCSVKISLCRPDHLLIGGIVDNSVIAGLATSTHLTLGNYVSVRRSAPLLLPHLWGDEGVLAVLHDLASALARIVGEEGEGCYREAPWVTAGSYGILLCIWSALRRATKDIQNHLDTFNELPRISESCMLIFNTLMESVLGFGGRVRDPRIWSTNRQAFASLLEEGELLFVSLLQRVCRDRFVWGIGPSMATVIDEILATPQTTTALA
ncbi:uncharacterized protein BDV14DRAFT_200111 [Aspergillus stella-maris]|uniref:uncharacterized protein n=1 Tax=Aspergillus stella-maris TaxID=1810926 RepID=UPI003CCD5F96